ncbi:extracellular solute-binding protein [Blautia sp.]|uniref:extracellular solute-binding protein n=1 Tax=Blautia sp. TaxID=1955243 RepID=UPI00257E736F|nr:extracellular solute-binding protein [Blautia sp.]MBS7174455.1 extracellular solute-binding protein [Blautia sp.]
MKIKRMGAVFFLVVCVFCGCGKHEISHEKNGQNVSEEYRRAMEKAETTPYGAYPELVTYTLAQISGANNSNLPEGDTYEDNAYTRYLRKMLNIQNDTVYMDTEERYSELVNILVKDQNLPDIMVVTDREILKELVENDLVEDLTEVFEKCTSSRIKEMYESYGDALLNSGKFNGRLMAVPETVIDHGPNLLWLRKDWMEELGLEEPETLEDAFEIIDAFVQNRMGTEDGETPVGLACDTNLVGTTSSSYSVDPVFDSFGANPQRWISQDGEIVYGSLTEETKEALDYLHKLYDRRILDRNFALRAPNNLRDLVVNGKCGAFFGLWWTPNNPLMESYEKNSEADWEPYYLQELADKNVYESFRDNKYVVVRKGYEHPEIVMKIISVLFDYTRYEAEDAREVNEYFALNVDPTARPLVINVDYNEATYQVTENIEAALNGNYPEGNLTAIEQSYYQACSSYLSGNDYTAEDWAAYKSRISAVGLLVDKHYTPAVRSCLDDAGGEIPQSLRQFETRTFIQIIMGEKPVSYFETFVEQWYQQGGYELTQQIRLSNPST